MRKHETISTKKFAFLIVTLWIRNNYVFGHFSRSTSKANSAKVKLEQTK